MKMKEFFLGASELWKFSSAAGGVRFWGDSDVFFRAVFGALSFSLGGTCKGNVL